MKAVFSAAAAAVAAIIVCGQAAAQTGTDILQRLEALEQSNAELRKENAALRDRVRRIESTSQTPAAASTQPASKPTRPGSAYAAVSANAPVYKAAPAALPAPWSWTGFYIGAHGGYAWDGRPGPM